MSQTTPLISILIRSMARTTLDQALTSVAKQSWPNVEVLIINASGTPHPPLPANFPFPVQLIDPGEPLQRSHAANLLLQTATGRWALFLDDDDWLEPEHLTNLANALIQHPKHILAYGDVTCVEETATSGEYHVVRQYDRPFDPLRLLVENHIPIHAALFDLERVHHTAGVAFDPQLDLFEDWDFWLQLLQLGSFLHVPGVGGWYRIHSTSGAGVRISEESQATRALTQVLHKWRTQWTSQQLYELFGLARHFYSQQETLEETERHISSLQKKLEHERCELERAHTLQTTLRQQNQQTLEALRQANQQQLDDLRLYYENSRSWQFTQPIRVLAHHLRRLLPTSPSLRRKLFSKLLQLATRVYHAPAFAPFERLIPPILKRRIRNQLFGLSRDPSTLERPGTTLLKPASSDTLVSIVIPVYNHARYLHQCLDSALQQSWSSLEIIVVNDASPDPEVREILDSYQGEPRLTVIHQSENGGICQAQNRALMAAKGDIIAFLDCDDYLHPRAIEISMKHWQDDTIYAHTGRINVDEHGKEINRIHFVDLPREDYFQENLRAMYATHLKLIRRDAFAKVGLFDPRFDTAQDYEMLMRIAFHYPSSSFVHVPDFVYHHRLHPQQATEQQNEKQNRLTGQIQHEARLRETIRKGDYGRFISVIMLSYGKHSQTLAAIQGLQQTMRIPHEIILYDNGSTEETVQFIREHIDGQFEQVRVFYGDENLGPAQGRRKALEHAQGEWFIIFDNDEVPEPGWLEELLVRAEVNENVGAVCCRVVFPDGKLQFSGGFSSIEDQRIELGLYDIGSQYDELQTCQFRTVDWCPIGATLFTENIAPYLHSGYPNVFEDAGVSFALKKKGLQLLNAPGALVWHDHVTYQVNVEMSKEYMQARYNPEKMLTSIASFYRENGLVIHDDYVWRENRLTGLTIEQVIHRLEQTAKQHDGSTALTPQ